ncbi:Sensor histidine kinase RcsC [Caballeronia sp. SBC1]|nr:Sensor histidine kinase RcsC [Caballeronia sp. SBC1]
MPLSWCLPLEKSFVMAAAVPFNESHRLQKLKTLGILDTPAEAHFDAITKLAASLLQTPIALLNFIDDAREWCKSAWGIEPQPTKREESLCAQALLTNDILVISDATADDEFRNHPQVVGERNVVFYVGAVLKASDGTALGTLCVIAHEPRNLSESEKTTLISLAEHAVLHLEKRQASEELLEMRRRLEAAEQHQQEFLAMLAHELRAPLAPIQTGIAIVDRPEATDAERAWARGLVRRYVEQMGHIVDDLLSTSLATTGVMQLNIEPVSVKDLIENALELTNAAIVDRGHTISTSVDATLYAFADRTQSSIVIANMLENAAIYTPTNGRIHLKVEGADSSVFIRVTDNGVGIAQEEIDAIFLLFKQGKRPLARSIGGMGLGLTLARKLAELHGGTLVAQSEGVGRGSEFTLRLRRASPQDIPPTGRVEVAASTMPMSILIAEDNHDTADALALYLQLSGNTARVAYNAAEALAIAKEWRPEVVLSDIGLPDMDGYALIRAMRSLDCLANTTFVAITGYASDSDKIAAIEAGFDAHMTKPVDATSLEEFLRRARASNEPEH